MTKASPEIIRPICEIVVSRHLGGNKAATNLIRILKAVDFMASNGLEVVIPQPEIRGTKESKIKKSI